MTLFITLLQPSRFALDEWNFHCVPISAALPTEHSSSPIASGAFFVPPPPFALLRAAHRRRAALLAAIYILKARQSADSVRHLKFRYVRVCEGIKRAHRNADAIRTSLPAKDAAEMRPSRTADGDAVPRYGIMLAKKPPREEERSEVRSELCHSH